MPPTDDPSSTPPTPDPGGSRQSDAASDAQLSGQSKTILPPGVQQGSGAFSASSMPDSIDGFRVVGLIASGGMGSVFEAVQETPRRRVALKMIRPDRTTPTLLARFQFEAQILARLRHPNIAQIYQAGTWHSPEGDVPYFAMEYIPAAMSVTEYVASNDLSLRDRLVLFMKICDAVHHGHLKGVVHRDLKPANILVTSSGEPKLIDFGVARATDSDQAAITQMTNVGQLIGTVQYMSPEQCDADPEDIDARSDVYSLGVVMYELLSDHLPYDLQGAALHEVVRVIKEDAPTSLSTLHAELAGDVETIARKALEKTRSRRYQSALEMRSDIGRFLDDEPILARPPSRMYLLSKFAKRHRALVACSCIIAVLVIGGLIATSIALSVITDQRNTLSAANTQLQAQVGMASTLGGDIYGRLQRIDASLDIRRDIADMVLERADALHEAGLDTALDPQARQALMHSRIRARMDVADVLGGCRGAYTNLGRPLDAAPLYAEAASLLEAWRSSDPDHPEATLILIELRTRDGDVRYLTGAVDRAAPHYQEAIDIGRDLMQRELAGPRHVQATSQAALRLADCHVDLDDLDEAVAAIRDARDILDAIAASDRTLGMQRDLALIVRREGFAVFERLEAGGDRDRARTAARPMYEDALAQFESLARAQPANGRAARDWAWALYYLAYLEAGGEHQPRGREAISMAIDLQVSQLQRNRQDADARADLLLMMEQCSALEPHLGGPPLMRSAGTRVLERLLPMMRQHPDDADLKRLIGRVEGLLQAHPGSP
ncbi:MAG: serine/threonine protein kinase [Phycisphaerales bacterium]|nr:serine/threonine protein kinase [Phycisphaerales bacterium]